MITTIIGTIQDIIRVTSDNKDTFERTNGYQLTLKVEGEKTTDAHVFPLTKEEVKGLTIGDIIVITVARGDRP